MFLINSCITPFYPDLDDIEEVLVVDGHIHDGEGPYTIRLNLSDGIYFNEYLPVEGATVALRDDQGNTEELFEAEAGVYQTDPDFRGIPGRAYALTIDNARGNSYESTFEVLPEPTGIDSIYAEIAYRNRLDAIGELPGYQFYINGTPPPTGDNYYLFDLTTTYKYNAFYPATYIYASPGNLRRYSEPFALYTCFKTQQQDDIYLYSTEGLSNQQINGFPLNFEGTNSLALSIRYSLHVKLFSLTKEAYRYWEQIKQINATGGALFTQQPYQLAGNINSTTTDVKALGYFFASGLREKRIFVNRPPNVPFYGPECFLLTVDLGRLLEKIDEFPVFLTEGDEGPTLAVQGCIDCRERGGVLEEPDFWEE